MLQKPPTKTRWGCLVMPICLALLLIEENVRVRWYASRPIEVHLRDEFTGSGFKVPEGVFEIRGRIGERDFQGDYSACVTFFVRPDQIDQFMQVSSHGWLKPDDFKPWDDPHNFIRGGSLESNVDEIVAPAGTFIIEQWGPGEIMRRYGVNKSTRQIFYERSSW